MALASTIVWEVRTAGSDTNGGGFKASASGTDYSQQDAKNTVGNNISTTDAVANGTTTLTSAGATFTSAIVGNVIYLAGGTGSITGVWREVTGFTNATTITIDATVAASTGMTLNIGGALASGGQAAGPAVNGNTIFVKNGTYTITTTTTDVSGGTWNFGTFKNISFVGYGTDRTRTNTDTKPLIQFNSGLASCTFTNSDALFINLALDGNNQTSAKLSSANGYFYRCSFTGFTAAGNGNQFMFCSATANSAGVLAGHCFGCEAYSNTATPFVSISHASRCLSYNNTGASTNGFTSTGGLFSHCVAYGNGQFGFALGSKVNAINCHAENNTGVGFSSSVVNGLLLNCSGYNNSAFITASSITPQIGTITPTGTVFIAAGSNNFALNDIPSQGALLRAAGIPGAFPIAATTGYPDIGAVQSHPPPFGHPGLA